VGGNPLAAEAVRLEAFSDGVLGIAITLLNLDVRVDQQPGESLAAALGHAIRLRRVAERTQGRRLRRQLPADRDHVGQLPRTRARRLRPNDRDGSLLLGAQPGRTHQARHA